MPSPATSVHGAVDRSRPGLTGGGQVATCLSGESRRLGDSAFEARACMPAHTQHKNIQGAKRIEPRCRAHAVRAYELARENLADGWAKTSLCAWRACDNVLALPGDGLIEIFAELSKPHFGRLFFADGM